MATEKGSIPKDIIKKAVHHLPSHFRKVITDFAVATEYQLPKCIYKKVINTSCGTQELSINFA